MWKNKTLKFVKNEKLILFVIIAVALLVRLYKINSPIADWHSFRQADTASVSRQYLKNGINLLLPAYHDVSSIQSGFLNPKGHRFVEFPIYNAIHVFVARNIGIFSFEVWGRLVSIIFSLISVYLIYILGKIYLKGWGGIYAAFFMAFLPFNIYYSRVILPEPLAVTSFLFSFVLFTKFLKSESNKYLYFSALSFSVTLLIKPYLIFFTLPLFVLYLEKYSLEEILQKGVLLLRLFLFIGLLVVPLLLWRLWVNQFPAGIPLFEWTFNGDMIRFRPAFWRWLFVERLGRLILGVWGTSIFTIGLLANKSKFLNYFLLSILIYVSVVATGNVKHDYYQIAVIPAIALTLAVGCKYILDKFKGLKGYFVVIFVTLLSLGASLYQVKEYYKINHPEIIVAGEAVNRISQEGDLIIAPYNGDTAFLYQTGRRGWAVVDRSFDEIIDAGADYYVSVNLHDLDNKYIQENYEIVEITEQYIIADLKKPIK